MQLVWQVEIRLEPPDVERQKQKKEKEASRYHTVQFSCAWI